MARLFCESERASDTRIKLIVDEVIVHPAGIGRLAKKIDQGERHYPILLPPSIFPNYIQAMQSFAVKMVAGRNGMVRAVNGKRTILQQIVAVFEIILLRQSSQSRREIRHGRHPFA